MLGPDSDDWREPAAHEEPEVTGVPPWAAPDGPGAPLDPATEAELAEHARLRAELDAAVAALDRDRAERRERREGMWPVAVVGLVLLAVFLIGIVVWNMIGGIERQEPRIPSGLPAVSAVDARV